MFAVIKTGGKQYLVEEGQEVKIEKLKGTEEGDKVDFEVMLVSDDEGKDLSLGKPFLEGAKVEGTITENGRDKKLEVVKFKRKIRYRRHIGHRQPFTKVKIEKISA